MTVSIQALDFGVDPCDDFYAFSCNNYNRANVLPIYGGRTWALDEAADAVRNFTTPLLENDNGEAGIFYRSCMNTRAIEEKGNSPLKQVLASVSNVRDRRSLTEYLVKFCFEFVNVHTAVICNIPQIATAERRMQAFISWGISLNETDEQYRLPLLSPGPITLPEWAYSDALDSARQVGSDPLKRACLA